MTEAPALEMDRFIAVSYTSGETCDSLSLLRLRKDAFRSGLQDFVKEEKYNTGR